MTEFSTLKSIVYTQICLSWKIKHMNWAFKKIKTDQQLQLVDSLFEQTTEWNYKKSKKLDKYLDLTRKLKKKNP